MNVDFDTLFFCLKNCSIQPSKQFILSSLLYIQLLQRLLTIPYNFWKKYTVFDLVCHKNVIVVVA